MKELLEEILEITESTPELGEKFTKDEAKAVDEALTKVQRLCIRALNNEP